MRHLTSLTNPKIKFLRSLHDRRHRKESGEFLAEGMRIITEALDLGWVVRCLIFSASRADDANVRTLVKRAEAKGAEVIMVSDAVLAKISRKDNPQMVIASVEEAWGKEEDAFTASEGCWVVLDRIRDPGNLGTVLRTIDAVAGRGAILVGDCCDAFSAEVVRASMGAIFNVSLVRMSEANFINAVQHYKGAVIGTALSATSDYQKASWSEPCLIMLGNEQSGLTSALQDVATDLIRIPMQGRSDSLNLAVSAGVVLYELRRHCPVPL